MFVPVYLDRLSTKKYQHGKANITFRSTTHVIVHPLPEAVANFLFDHLGRLHISNLVELPSTLGRKQKDIAGFAVGKYSTV